jgi:hypothetical protein
MYEPSDTFNPDTKTMIDGNPGELVSLCKGAFRDQWEEYLAEAYFAAIKRNSLKFLPGFLRHDVIRRVYGRRGIRNSPSVKTVQLPEDRPIAPEVPSEESEVEQRDELAQLRDYIERLPPDCRSVMKLLAKGYEIRRGKCTIPGRDVSAELGISKSEADRLKHSGIQKLRRMFHGAAA